jgi:protein TonB
MIKMKLKKNADVSLDKKRNLFFMIGLVVTLSAALMAFEWKSDGDNAIVFDNNWVIEEAELLPIIRPPEPPQPKVEKKIITQIKVAEKDDEVKDDAPEIRTSEWDDLVAIEPVDFGDELDDPTTLIDYVKVEDKPYFKGGQKAFYKFLRNNLVYPEQAKQNGVEGRIFVEFTIDIDGSIIDANVVRPFDQFLDKEAERVFKVMPKWVPGKQRGQAVQVRYVLPINFVLSE